ncbi:MAG: histidine kinase, partial [Bacteroidota bacterium]
RVNGLADNSILDLFLDFKGRIWMAGAARQLSWYENGQIYRYKGNRNLRTRLETDHILSVGTDKEDRLWIGTTRGLFVGSLHDSLLTLLDGPEANSGFFNVRTVEGTPVFYRNHRKRDHGVCIDGLNILPDYGPENANWTGHESAVLMDNGDYLLNLRDDVLRIRPKDSTVNVQSVSAMSLRTMHDQTDHIWVAMRSNGAVRLPGDLSEDGEATWLFEDQSVTSVFQDQAGGFWFTTIGKGLHHIPAMECRTLRAGKELSGATPTCFLGRPDGAMWVGYQEGGVDRCLPEAVSVVQSADQPHFETEIRQLEGAGKEAVLAAVTSQEIFKLNDPSGELKLVHPKPYRVFACDGRSVWLVGYGRLEELDLETKSILRTVSFPAELVRDICKAGQDELLIATFDGVFAMDLKTGKSAPLVRNAPLLQERTEKIVRAGATYLMATRGRGLVLVQRKAGQDSVWQIGEAEGLASNLSNHVFAEHDSVVWVSTHRGLNKLVFDPGWQLRSISVYNYFDGLASNQVLQSWVHGDRIWTCTAAGLTTFRRDYRPNLREIPIYLTQFQVNQRDTNIVPGYTLRHNQNDLHFGFHAITFRKKPAFGYEYRLKGLDTLWTYTADTAANFSKLPPGDYDFEVRAVARAGVPATETLSLPFHIRSPWWENPWLPPAGVAVVLLGFGLILRSRNLRARRRMALEKTIAELQSQALRAQMNPHFAFNALNTVQHYITHGDEEAAVAQLGKFSALLRLVLRHSNAEWIRMEDELHMLRLYLDLERQRFEDTFSSTIEVDPEFDTAFDRVPPMVLQPFVENAIWHGLLPKDGPRRLSIHLKREGPRAQCTIEDNGVGRAYHEGGHNKEDHFSLGISVTRKRLALILDEDQRPGDVRIEDLKHPDGSAAGTRIHLTIPLN